MNHGAGTMSDQTLREIAEGARDRAWAPYSNFPVGAALETETGEIFAGCNVENASFGLTICAERGAVMAAVAAGHRRFRRIFISTNDVLPTPPCGACRQVLAEFAPELEVLSSVDGRIQRWTMNELLPARFLFDGGSEKAGERSSGRVDG
jgi:cytidine deaminase